MKDFHDGIKDTFYDLYTRNMANQLLALNEGLYDSVSEYVKAARKRYGDYLNLPTDEVNIFSYHIQQLISEVGEVLDSDKRWKTNRNGKYDKENKLEELADCYIELMNLATFSGFTADQMANAISHKLETVYDRFSSMGDIENIK